MKIRIRFIAIFFLFIFPFISKAQAYKIILDTDIDSDVDDVGALAMLHTLADHQVVDILGVVVTSDDQYAAQCTDAINHYFNRGNIPVGVEKGISLRSFSKYTREISQEYNHNIKSSEDAEDATSLYRRLLSGQPDSTVIIITVGHLTNLRNLMESKADEYSDLSGMDLIKKKVKLWSCMGGMFPEGKEANFYRPDPESTKIAVENWPGRVVFAGWEIGNEIITGSDFLKKSLPEESPVWRAYQLYNNFKGRQSWDQASILYAISSSDNYWDLEENGRCVVMADGSNRWAKGDSSNHAYLIPKMNPIEVAKIIDALMVGFYSPDF